MIKQNIANGIAHISQINNQTAIMVSTTFTIDTNSFTSLGGAIGTINNDEDLNNLINRATYACYQNLPSQQPNIQLNQISYQQELSQSNRIHQPTQNSPSNPINKQQSSKQKFSKQHSTTRIASESQQNLIRKLCDERNKNLNNILYSYNKDLPNLTSAEANEIIQEIKNNKNQ